MTFTLLGIVLWITPLHETWRRISQADPFWLGATVVASVMSLWMQAIRWNILLDLKESRVGQLFRLQLIGTAAGFFLPSALAGDIVRSALLAREQEMLERSILSAVLGRIFGLVSMMTLALIGALFWHHPGLRFQPGPTAMALAVCGGLALLPAWYAWKRLRRNAAWWEQGAAWKLRIFQGLSYLDQAIRKPALVAKAFVFSLLLQAFTLMAGWFIYKAVGADLSLAAAYALQPLIQLGSIAPLSVGGVGVREGIGMALFHGLVGLPREVCLAAMAMGYVSSLLLSIPGIFLAYPEWVKKRQAPPPPPA